MERATRIGWTVIAAMTAIGWMAPASRAATISFAGSIINDASSEISRWKTTSVAKSLDADGDDRYGTTAHLFYSIEFKGQNTLYTFNSSDTQVGPFAGYDVVDHPDLEDNPLAGTTQVRTTSNSGAAANDTMFTFTALAASPRAVRIGVVIDGLDSANFSPSSIGLRQTVGGSASVEQAVVANSTADMYFFDVYGMKATDQFQVFADPGSGGFTTHQIVTWDAITRPHENGDVIKLDFSTTGDADGGSLLDWNQVSTNFNNGGIPAGKVIRHGDGTVIEGVSISFTGLNNAAFNNDGASNNWAGTSADPYYVGGADDIYFNNDGNPFSTIIGGLNESQLYEVRIYSLIGNSASTLDTFEVIGLGGMQSVTNSRGARWGAATLEAAGMVFYTKPDINGNITISNPSGGAYPLNAIVLVAIPAPAALPAGLAMLGVCMVRRRRL